MLAPWLAIPSKVPADFDKDARVLSPCDLAFLPQNDWLGRGLKTLSELRDEYFSRRNVRGRSFDLKLWNGLRITKYFPGSFPYIGLYWIIAGELFKVDSRCLAGLLGVRARQAVLWHRQGKFRRCESFELVTRDSPAVRALGLRLPDVDDFEVRLVRVRDGRFGHHIRLGPTGEVTWFDQPAK